MADNYYIRKGYSTEELNMQEKMLDARLEVLNDLFNDMADLEHVTTMHQNALDLAQDGYDIAEQIFDAYAELGAIYEARERLEKR